ncbi:MAG: cyclic nucleotide-binding domain-containing protein, partial [Pseudomonadota bacterium]
MRDILEAHSPLLQDLLPSRLLRQLQQIARTISYRDGQIIHSRGDAKPGLSMVRQGLVQVGNFGSDGSYITTSTLGPGQCFGEFTLFAGLPRTHSITARGDCEVDQIPGPAFMRLFNREPELARAMLTISLIRTHGLLEFLDDLRRLPLLVRVAKVLLQ